MKKVSTLNAPQAIGPYSQAIIAGEYVFCSGQIPLDKDGVLVSGGVSDQAKQVLNNMNEVLISAGSSFGKVVKTTIFLKSMEDFGIVNEVYSQFFVGDTKPARSTVEVSRLPKDVLVEIDCIAML
ncbi:reactive intermediate/imine deaminase [Candidatus Peregrinibacteria bacterium CG10_big_fil_rev_8_21_14_0_10_36_19]|nr:MAG: reactive intermediate/imine deaminase [Candidatus Peregrinibacteria bacterium CG10_big_fil_rev_8_21_14_0_10_36_19]